MEYLLYKFDDKYSEEVNMNHIDSCANCWDLWNQVRWDSAKQSIGMKELREYLGSDFIEYFDSSWALADEWNNKNPTTKNEILDFYKNTKNYLFNLVIWYESGDRRNFHADLERLISEFSIKSVIDFGCGVGSDTLYLLENNMRTFMVDFNCPSADFLKWRIKKRNLFGGDFINADEIGMLPDGEMFWTIDVLEHMFNPVEAISMMSDKTKVFVHHSQFNDKAGGRHPCHIDFEEKKLNDALHERGFVNIPWNNMSVWVKKYLLK